MSCIGAIIWDLHTLTKTTWTKLDDTSKQIAVREIAVLINDLSGRDRIKSLLQDTTPNTHNLRVGILGALSEIALSGADASIAQNALSLLRQQETNETPQIGGQSHRHHNRESESSRALSNAIRTTTALSADAHQVGDRVAGLIRFVDGNSAKSDHAILAIGAIARLAEKGVPEAKNALVEVLGDDSTFPNDLKKANRLEAIFSALVTTGDGFARNALLKACLFGRYASEDQATSPATVSNSKIVTALQRIEASLVAGSQKQIADACMLLMQHSSDQTVQDAALRAVSAGVACDHVLYRVLANNQKADDLCFNPEMGPGSGDTISRATFDTIRIREISLRVLRSSPPTTLLAALSEEQHLSRWLSDEYGRQHGPVVIDSLKNRADYYGQTLLQQLATHNNILGAAAIKALTSSNDESKRAVGDILPFLANSAVAAECFESALNTTSDNPDVFDGLESSLDRQSGFDSRDTSGEAQIYYSLISGNLLSHRIARLCLAIVKHDSNSSVSITNFAKLYALANKGALQRFETRIANFVDSRIRASGSNAGTVAADYAKTILNFTKDPQSVYEAFRALEEFPSAQGCILANSYLTKTAPSQLRGNETNVRDTRDLLLARSAAYLAEFRDLAAQCLSEKDISSARALTMKIAQGQVSVGNFDTKAASDHATGAYLRGIRQFGIEALWRTAQIYSGKAWVFLTRKFLP